MSCRDLRLSSAFCSRVTLEQVQRLSDLTCALGTHGRKQVQSLAGLQNNVMTPRSRETLRHWCEGSHGPRQQPGPLLSLAGKDVGRLWFAVSYCTVLCPSLWLLTRKPTTFLSSSASADLASPTLKISRYRVCARISVHNTHARAHTRGGTVHTHTQEHVYTQCHGL